MGKTMTMWAATLLLATAGLAHAGEISVKRGGYTLQGEETGTGNTTVVFEAGFGQGPAAWKQVIAGLGGDYRSIAYARAGLGTSGTDGVTKRIDDNLSDLDALIETVAPGQQVILVGHSYGGLPVTEFCGAIRSVCAASCWWTRQRWACASPTGRRMRRGYRRTTRLC